MHVDTVVRTECIHVHAWSHDLQIHIAILNSFPSVPGNLTISVFLTPPNPTGTIGSPINLTCTAVFSADVIETMIQFDYGFMSNTVAAVAGITQTDMATISSVSLSSAGEYTCTVTVTASGVCGGNGSEPACPTKTSDAISLTVQCERYCHNSGL